MSSTMFIIAKREINKYFSSPVAYLFILVYIVLQTWLFLDKFFLIKQASVNQLFALTPLIFFALVPALAMGQWADENKARTIELLLTMPVKDHEVVYGKFLATFGITLIAIAFTLPLVITVGFLGPLDLGVIFTSYIGIILLGATMVSICLFLSALTNNQVVAFILGLVALFILMFLGEPIFTSNIPITFIAKLFQFIGLTRNFADMARGMIDTRNLLYFLSLIFLFNYLTLRTVQQRKFA